ncbi:MAG: glycoside hydrolase [Firmicutes bacterium]|jgi:alpha-amylase/alpha-mannosidase (GH57 family)|nr:glycoside hydrolase [Bacillota bacterium]
MPERPLYVAFVWNQHQPFYQDTVRKEYIMPWVRLHGSKDYYQMAAILEEYPRIHQTFNLTPSLLEQVEDYLEGGAVDYYMRVMKPVELLSEGEKRFLLQHFFDIQWDKVIAKFSAYRALLDKQGRVREPAAIERALSLFSSQDYLDLQVWFNLVWIDPEIRERERFFANLLEKGSGFTESEKEELMERQLGLLRLIVPIHRQLREKKQIELITTPFYHPILPLIIDTQSALRAAPGLQLPERFHYKEDAYWQLEKACQQYQHYFGAQPQGLWPPEQAVSPEIIPLAADMGFTWTITDEQILSKTLGAEIIRDGYGHVLNPDLLYRPYLVSIEGATMAIVFRDHHLSDRIGFEYQHLHAEHAAKDLVHRLHKIRENLGRTEENHLVTIALDGENAWEWYENDKRDFLHHLYRLLSEDPLLRCVTVSEFLAANPPRRQLQHLFTGSWVDHSLVRWISTENKNKLWSYLARARKDLETARYYEGDTQRVTEALRNIYIAEGSDYMWWVDSMPYYLAAPFEALFRKHLANVYRVLGLDYPAYLEKPLLKPEPGEPVWKEDPLGGPIAMIQVNR